MPTLQSLARAALRFGAALLASSSLAFASADGQARVATDDLRPQEREADVIYVPTPDAVVEAMLSLAEVKDGDVLFDLGSGDGRIPITAAKRFGIRATGIDINPDLVKKARENAAAAGVSDRVRFLQADLFKSDFREATVVSLYLLTSLNIKLRPKLLAELKPGTRIVSHDFGMGEWEPTRTIRVPGPHREHVVHLWIVPDEPPAGLGGAR